MVFRVIDGSIEIGLIVLRFFIVLSFGVGNLRLDHGLFDGLNQNFLLALLIAHLGWRG
jgi:hypothetical protein